MTKYRYTVEIKQAGQPRPYADSVYHTVVQFEKQPDGKVEWEPYHIAERFIGGHLNSLPNVRYCAVTKAEAGVLQSYREFLRPLDAIPMYEGSSDRKASLWEIKVIQPFCD